MALTKEEEFELDKKLEVNIRKNGCTTITYHKNRELYDKFVRELRKVGVNIEEIQHIYMPVECNNSRGFVYAFSIKTADSLEQKEEQDV